MLLTHTYIPQFSTKISLYAILLIWMMSLSSLALGQEVKGRLIDEEGKPYPNAKVFWEGYENHNKCYTYTNEEGEFVLTIKGILRKDTLYLHAKSPDPELSWVNIPYKSPITLKSIPSFITFQIPRVVFQRPLGTIVKSKKPDIIQDKKDSVTAFNENISEINNLKTSDSLEKPLLKNQIKENQPKEGANNDSKDTFENQTPTSSNTGQEDNKEDTTLVLDNPTAAYQNLEAKVSTADQKLEDLGEEIEVVNKLLKEFQEQLDSGNLNEEQTATLQSKLNAIIERFEKIDFKYNGLKESIEAIKGAQKLIREVVLSIHTYRAYLIFIGILFILTAFSLYLLYRQRNKVLEKSGLLSNTLNEKMQLIEEKDVLIKEKEALVEEKVTLINEINHRVRNNLDLISSIIYFRFKGIEHPETHNAAMDVRNRIDSLGIIYHMLNDYQSLNTLPIKRYINKLLSNLKKAFNHPKKEININQDIQDLRVNVKDLVPLALIIHELVSNSFKHAFEGRDSGEIQVKFHELEQNNFQLFIRDNGVGISQSKNNSLKPEHSLGTKLVENLTSQLGARIIQNCENGTSYSLIFSV